MVWNALFMLLFFSLSVMSNFLWLHGLQHPRLPYPSLSPIVCSNSCPLSQWCHPTISFSVTPFSSCPQSFTSLESFPMSWLFASGGQSIGASASVLPVSSHGSFRLELTKCGAGEDNWTFLGQQGDQSNYTPVKKKEPNLSVIVI